MKRSILNNAGLFFLAIVFSTGLIFAFIELPRLLDSSLQNNLGFPQFDQGMGDTAAFKTELFIQALHLRWIGYASLILILGLIIFGYASRRSGWALAGAVGLFIPVFGQFAFSMFFLAGLGFLRVGWLPFIEVSSINILDLGKVIYVPFWILRWLLGLFDWNPQNFISWIFMAGGAFLFTWGVLLWFKSRYSGDRVATSWIYKLSRHPQYLGWILWSYGYILFSPFDKTMKMSWSIPSSLPWLLMTMTIVGICMLEEIKMMEVTGGRYQEYRRSAPFLFPLPSILNRILTWPARLVTRGTYPEKRMQVLWIVLIYTGICMALSLIWMDLGRSETLEPGSAEARQELSVIMARLEESGDRRREIYALMEDLPDYGEAGLHSLYRLAENPNSHMREFAIQFLGEMKAGRAEDLIIRSLNDSIKRVRSAAIIAAGQIRSERAVDPLGRMLTDPVQENHTFLIYGALGDIGDETAIPFLTRGLEDGPNYNQIAALGALMEIDPQTGLTHAFSELNDPDVEVRRNAVITCIRTGDPKAIEPLRALTRDEDFEIRIYARQGIKRLGK
jgi:protein-S-isoprenylcysteine O-methyltransferase Ste14